MLIQKIQQIMINTEQQNDMPSNNVDQQETDKFSALAHQWWDPTGNFRPLHDINPLRLDWIEDILGGAGSIKGKTVVDIGCGGGLVSEGLASRGNDSSAITGIDMADKPLKIARLHALESNITAPRLEYLLTTAESLAQTRPNSCDAVTCLEMLEHVPNPASVIDACAKLAKPNAPIFFSTLNRNPLAYATAIVGAEYVLNFLPKGTHDYNKFITPAELAQMARAAGLRVESIRGMDYNPFTHVARWSSHPWVNYAVLCYKNS
jgi:2-polyprenyl-6-hydroxyphenyl methylase / 3-demethylubiquinone-9 3-methyltransferase